VTPSTPLDPQASAPPCFGSFDRELIEFFLQWEPFGGPTEEEAFPRFGLTCEQLRTRIETILSGQSTAPVSKPTDQLLLRSAAQVLGWCSRPTATSTHRVPSLANETEVELTVLPADPLGLPPNTMWRNDRGVWRCAARETPTSAATAVHLAANTRFGLSAVEESIPYPPTRYRALGESNDALG
jgi:hypothetical protein